MFYPRDYPIDTLSLYIKLFTDKDFYLYLPPVILDNGFKVTLKVRKNGIGYFHFYKPGVKLHRADKFTILMFNNDLQFEQEKLLKNYNRVCWAYDYISKEDREKKDGLDLLNLILNLHGIFYASFEVLKNNWKGDY